MSAGPPLGRDRGPAQGGRGASHRARAVHRRHGTGARTAPRGPPALAPSPMPGSARSTLPARRRIRVSTVCSPAPISQPPSNRFRAPSGCRSTITRSRSTRCAMPESRSPWSPPRIGYVAEDALELIEVEYRPLPPVIDLKAAIGEDAALLHEAVGSNVVHHRSFRYGDPETAFAEADCVVRLDWTFPRYSSTPMETYGAIAQFEPAPDRYTIWSNFQGPFILHALMWRGARRAGQPAAPDHLPPERRQLRHQAGDVPLYGAAGGGQPSPRYAPQMGRGPARTPGGLVGGIQPRGRGRGRVPQRRHADGAQIPQPGRCRRLYPRAGAGIGLSHAQRLQRRLRGHEHFRRQPAGDDQPAADRPQPRIWRAPVLLCARTGDGCRRPRARHRYRRDQAAQFHPERRLPLPRAGRSALRRRRL